MTGFGINAQPSAMNQYVYQLHGATFQHTEILLLTPLWTSGLSEAKKTTWEAQK